MFLVDDQISDVWNPSKGVGKNKNRVAFVKQGVRQEQQGANQAQPPKSCRHDNPLQFFGCIPLDEEAAEKHGVSDPADHLPPVPFDSEKLAIGPNQAVPPIHFHNDSRLSLALKTKRQKIAVLIERNLRYDLRETLPRADGAGHLLRFIGTGRRW
jgi:hypothetical protein